MRVFLWGRKMPLPNILEFIGTNISQRKFQEAQEKLLNYLGIEVPTKSELNSEISKVNSAITPKADKVYVDNALTAIAGGHKAYQTLALAQAAQASLPVNTIVEVTNDSTTSNNGTYQWNGTTLTKSAYDPLTQAKADATTKANAAEANAKTYTDLSVHQLVSSHASSILVNTGKLYELSLVTYDTSDFITVQSEDIITVTSQIYGTTEICRFYRPDRTVLSSANNPTTINGVFTTSVTVPSNAAFVKIASANSNRAGYIHYTFSATVSRLKTNTVKAELIAEIDKLNNDLVLTMNNNTLFIGSDNFLYSSASYDESIELKTYGLTKLYALLHSAGSINWVRVRKVDGSIVTLEVSPNTLSVFNKVIDLPIDTVGVILRTAGKTNSNYLDGLYPIAVLADNEKDIIKALNNHYESQAQSNFDIVRSSYNRTKYIPIVKGNVIEYSVQASGYAGVVTTNQDVSSNITQNQGVLSFDEFAYLYLHSYGATHANYNADFTPMYNWQPDDAALQSTGRKPLSSEITGLYFPNLVLKSIRDVSFTDGSDKQSMQYLWQDGLNNFYISSSPEGDKKYVFTYYPSDFYNYEPHWFSMNFDKYGNIICVFRTEGVSSPSYTNTNRRNPIVLLKNENYKPTIIDFGAEIKPSGWLQNCGFLCTNDAIFLTEYTRPTVETAHTWKVNYPITNAANWKKVQSFVVNPNGTNFKHIHNVDRDPYTGFIYTSTGDDDIGAGIYVSTDNGETFTTILSGSEKYCRVLNWVFTKDKIYWATDSSGYNHWLFETSRNPTTKVIDTANITDVYRFPDASAPTYATIYLKKINALLFLGRKDGASPSVPVDLWDLSNGTFHTIDNIPTVGGVDSTLGFRCECFEYIPRGNDVVCGFSKSVGPGGYLNTLGLLGNTQDAQRKVNNIKITVDRVGNEFSINYSTVVL